MRPMSRVAAKLDLKMPCMLKFNRRAKWRGYVAKTQGPRAKAGS